MKKLFIFFLLLLIAGCSKKPNVVTLKSGLQYVDDTVGTGAQAKEGELISVKYSVWLIKNSKDLFKDWNNDSTKAKSLIGTNNNRKTPIKFVLSPGRFVKGSEKGIEGMKVGGTRTIIIPSKLAYGKRGVGPIPPNSDIKVQLQLLNISQPAKEWTIDSSKIQTTKDGLKYEIIKEGTGPKAKPGDIVTVDYSGYLLDGKKFDSSVDRGQPFKFKLGGHSVIQGWEEGIALLNKGAKARLIIPPALGYGNRNMGIIPPNSTLVFDIHLVDIQ